MTFVEAMTAAQAGFDTWAAKPHNKKWAKMVYHTPIPNDLLVNIAEAVAGRDDQRRTEIISDINPESPVELQDAVRVADAVLERDCKGDASSIRARLAEYRHNPHHTNPMSERFQKLLDVVDGRLRLADSFDSMCDDNEELRDYARFLESRNWWQRLLNAGV